MRCARLEWHARAAWDVLWLSRVPLHLALSFFTRRNWKPLEVNRGTLRAVHRLGVRMPRFHEAQLCDCATLPTRLNNVFSPNSAIFLSRQNWFPANYIWLSYCASGSHEDRFGADTGTLLFAFSTISPSCPISLSSAAPFLTPKRVLRGIVIGRLRCWLAVFCLDAIAGLGIISNVLASSQYQKKS